MGHCKVSDCQSHGNQKQHKRIKITQELPLEEAGQDAATVKEQQMALFPSQRWQNSAESLLPRHTMKDQDERKMICGDGLSGPTYKKVCG